MSVILFSLPDSWPITAPREWKVEKQTIVADYSAALDHLNPKHWPAYTYPATAIVEMNCFGKETPMQAGCLILQSVQKRKVFPSDDLLGSKRSEIMPHGPLQHNLGLMTSSLLQGLGYARP